MGKLFFFLLGIATGACIVTGIMLFTDWLSMEPTPPCKNENYIVCFKPATNGITAPYVNMTINVGNVSINNAGNVVCKSFPLNDYIVEHTWLTHRLFFTNKVNPVETYEFNTYELSSHRKLCLD